MFLESSKDILYLVIAFCIVWVTVFLCWMFYYIMRLLRNANFIVEEFRSRLLVLSEAVDYIRNKVEHMSGLMTMVTEGVGGLVKKLVTKKAEQWVEKGSDAANEAAKEAVEKAVDATAQGMKRMVKKIKKDEVF